MLFVTIYANVGIKINFYTETAVTDIVKKKSSKKSSILVNLKWVGY